MIDKIEQSHLIKQKLREGKGIISAEKEVQRDINFLKKVKEQKSELRKEINKLIKEKQKLSKRFKKEFDKIKKIKEKPTKLPKHSTNANTKHLTRILDFLKENPDSNITNIADFICASNNLVNDGLRFLMKMKLVEVRRLNAVNKYKLIS